MTGPAFFFVCLIIWFLFCFFGGGEAGSTGLTLDPVHCTEESVVP